MGRNPGRDFNYWRPDRIDELVALWRALAIRDQPLDRLIRMRRHRLRADPQTECGVEGEKGSFAKEGRKLRQLPRISVRLACNRKKTRAEAVEGVVSRHRDRDRSQLAKSRERARQDYRAWKRIAASRTRGLRRCETERSRDHFAIRRDG